MWCRADVAVSSPCTQAKAPLARPVPLVCCGCSKSPRRALHPLEHRVVSSLARPPARFHTLSLSRPCLPFCKAASAPPLAPGLGLHPGLPLAIGSARMSFGSSSVTSAPQAPSPANSTSRNSTRGSVVSVASSSAASARRPRNSIVSSALVGQLPAANADTHVTVLQTGGTIDKVWFANVCVIRLSYTCSHSLAHVQDYPKTKGGYSFEIGAAAVKRVLRVLRVPAAFTVDVRTVCRKDSQDITEKV